MDGAAGRQTDSVKGVPMGKGGRKRRARRKNAANHGKRPTA